MTNELVEKLRRAFNEPATDEKQVVFIMSKTRKLIENERLDREFKLLKRYTDWSLHSNINDASPMRDVLSNLEKTILAHKYQPACILDMIDFVEFRKQLAQFLKRFGISHKLMQNEYWREFRKSFLEILVDCPLKPTFGEMTEFCFTRGTGDNIDYEIRFKAHPPVCGSFDFQGR